MQPYKKLTLYNTLILLYIKYNWTKSKLLFQKGESALIVEQRQRLFGGVMVTGIIYATPVDFITK